MPWFNRSDVPPKAVNWKTNLAALWLSQFLSLAAFQFSIPFMPLYLQEKEIVPRDQVAFWSGLFIAAASVSLMIMSPIWGTLGDRYGRKMMLVRANLGAGFVLYLMGLVENIEALIVLRLFQGAFAGTSAAAQTLVATGTPDRNQGFAMGLIMAAVNAGNMAGLYFGGISAQHYGPALSFRISGIILFVSTVLVVFAVRENFERPALLPGGNTRSARMRRRRESITNFKMGLPVFLTVGYLSYIMSFDGPYISLYIDHLYRLALPASSTLTGEEIVGLVYGLTGVVILPSSIGAMVGSITAGMVMDKKLPRWTWVAVATVTGLGLLLVSLSPTLISLSAGRAVFFLFAAGLSSVVVVILGRMTPSSKRGAALGWTVTIRAVGWILAPLSGAYAAHRLGWAGAYAVMAGCCILLIPAFIYLESRYRSAFHPDDDDPPSIRLVGKSQISQPSGHGKMA